MKWVAGELRRKLAACCFAWWVLSLACGDVSSGSGGGRSSSRSMATLSFRSFFPLSTFLWVLAFTSICFWALSLKLLIFDGILIVAFAAWEASSKSISLSSRGVAEGLLL